MSSILSPQNPRNRSRSVDSPPPKRERNEAWRTPDRRGEVVKLSALPAEIRWKGLPVGRDESDAGKVLRRPRVFENLDGYAGWVRPEGNPPMRGSPPPPKTLP